MEHLLEVLKILDGAVSADRKKVATYAEQLATKLEATGDPRGAQGIRRALSRQHSSTVSLARATAPLPVDSESRLALADESRFERGEVKVALSASTTSRVNEFIQHVTGADALLAHGLGIAPSALLYGPPGCGKTQLAKYIASELGLPLLTARVDTLISSYLGSTSKNIRLLFEHAMARPCVLFLDEVDAVAKLRDDQHELGELKRVVVSLLQNIDALDNKTVLVAATNHEHLLDRAIWRRFAFHLTIGLPTPEARAELAASFLGANVPPDLDIQHVAQATDGMSGAAIRQLCEEARRTAILAGQSRVSESDLLTRILRAQTESFDSLTVNQQIVAARKIDAKTFTLRRLSSMFAVSTGKISNLLRENEGS